MKKMLTLLAALALLVSLTACGSNSTNDTREPERDPLADMSLEEVMDATLKDVPDLPEYEKTPLTEETFEFSAFVPYEEGYEGLTADALITPVAHSVVLVRVPVEKAAEVAEAIRQNADPRKWICVEAEKTAVDYIGGTILLVMSSGETTNAILTNFKALYGEAPTEAELEIPETAEDLEDPGTEEVTPDDPNNMETETAAPDEPETIEPEGTSETAEEPVESETPAEPSVPAASEQPQEKPAAEKPATEKPTEEMPEAAAPETAQPAPVEPEQPSTPEPELTVSTDLSVRMAALLEGVGELPDLGEIELNEENLEFYAFIPYAEGYRGLASEAMMRATAHSVVLLELPTEEAALRAAEDMKANADPRKWICVEAENVQTAANGKLALLVMSTQELADAIIANFYSL